MNTFDIINLILGIFLMYYNLFIVYFSPIITDYDINNGYFYIVFISIIIDIVLFSIGVFSKGKIKFVNKLINKFTFLDDLFILNIVFRFFPILGHIGNFLSGYSNKKKILGLSTLFLGYIIVYLFGNLFFFILGKTFNPSFSTSLIDISYYSAILVSLFGIILFLVYFLFKFRNN